MAAKRREGFPDTDRSERRREESPLASRLAGRFDPVGYRRIALAAVACVVEFGKRQACNESSRARYRIASHSLDTGSREEPAATSAAQRSTAPAKSHVAALSYKASKTVAGPTRQSAGTPPKILHRVLPAYTEAAKQARIKGTVALEVAIQKDGSPKVLSVVQSLGYGLDKSASTAVEQWRFEPATEGGNAIDLKIDIDFDLK